MNHRGGYEYWNGPRMWSKMSPKTCAGYEQSPININPDQTVFTPYLPPFHLIEKYSPRSRFSVHNNGFTVQINVTGLVYVSNGGLGGQYKTEQIHFHWGDRNKYGSEHAMNGRHSPLEMHILNWASNKYRSSEEAALYPGGLAVFSILFTLSKYDNPMLEPIIQSLPLIADPDWESHVNFPAVPIGLLLPKHSHMFYRYRGSLTTPKCNEGVIWSVFHMPQSISYRQLHAFRKVLKREHGNLNRIKYYDGTLSIFEIFPGYSLSPKSRMVNNFRPVQPLNGRIVYRSF